MQRKNSMYGKCQIVGLAFALLSGVGDATAGGKIGVYGIRMVPDGADAERYSRPGWGG